MITYRLGFFETNSSSVHVLVIPKDTKLSIPKTVTLHRGEYGWSEDEVYNTLDYFYQACVDAGGDEVKKLFNYLLSKGVDEIRCIELGDDCGGDYGWIDHGNDIPLDELFSNESLLDRFIFGVDSFVETGNDNSANYCPSAKKYDPNLYDTITKYN